MPGRYPLKDSGGAAAEEIRATLEQGEVAYFERCPFDLPGEADLEFLRSGCGGLLRSKNLSYHPETDSVPRFEADAAVKQWVERILRAHGQQVARYWQRVLPGLSDGWQLGTTSFRPLEERGRQLKPRASNELVHVDAGAYGATNGARILRFFVNVNAVRDRVWHTKGSFHSLMARHPALWSAARGGRARVPLQKGLLDRAFSGLVRAATRLHPAARLADSSPYDRSMRRIHNYMKESAEFHRDSSGLAEMRFPPFSAWMVFTDGMSHAVVEGQHALVTTALIPLASFQRVDLSPWGILAADS